MNRFLFLFLLLISSLASAQTRYKVTTAADGQTQIVRKESISGSNVYDVVVGKLPTDAVRARLGGRVLLPYALEAKRSFNPGQFGSNKYYSSTFKFAPDFNPGPLPVAQRKAQGVNCFNWWSMGSDEKPGMTYGDAMLYQTEAGLHGDFEGAKYFESTLAEYEAKIDQTMPHCGYGDQAGVQLLVFNIEQSNDWHRNYYGDNGHWPSWESSKNKSVVCEFDGQTRTLEQIDQQNLWAAESAVRKNNRIKVMIKKARAFGRPGLQISYGASMYQGQPRIDFRENDNGIFQPGSADVSHIGGSAGTITLNGRTYSGMSGSFWNDEDVMCGYYYLFNFDISRADYNDIWVNHTAGTQNYPYLWGRTKIRHIVADEKGYLQLCRRRMQYHQGVKRGILRMMEPMYEADQSGIVDNTYPPEITRIPFSDLQHTNPDGGAEKIWQAPYLVYSRYAVTRFMAGADPGWGFYVFPLNFDAVRVDLSTNPRFNQELHTYTALFQARADLQPYEQFYSGSTLVEDPEVQLNGSGEFASYDGTTAFNYNDGVQGVQKPAYIVRYKPTTDGWRVIILGGMGQDWTQERTDIIRLPGGALNGNAFKVKLRGPAAQLYDFTVKLSDSNQLYEALPVTTTAWEKAGYAGRVN